MDKEYAYHKPSDAGLSRIRVLRRAFSDMKRVIERNVPDSPERSLALSRLKESSMWANGGVVLRDPSSTVIVEEED